MDFEKKSPLKSSIELAMEKTDKYSEKKQGEEKEQKELNQESKEESRPIKSTVDIAMERADRMMAESKANEDDVKKIKELEDKMGVDLSQSITEKQKEAASLASNAENKRNVDLGGMNIQEKVSMDEELDNLKLHKTQQEDLKKGLGGMGGAVDEELERINKNVIALESRRAGKTDNVKKEGPNTNKTMPEEAEETPHEYAKRDVREYLDDDQVSAHLTSEEIKKFNQEFSNEISATSDEDEINALTSKKINGINDFINNRRREQKIEADKPQEKVGVINKDVQSEALKDFTHKTKRGYERPKMEDDVVMQAMEDFIESAKSKDSISSTVKNFIGFLRNKKKDMKAGFKYTTNTVLGAMRDFSGYTKEKIDVAKEKMDERRKRPVEELSRIDRIMQGDNRSDEAVGIEKSMEKAAIEGMKEKLKVAENPEDLIRAMDGIKEITNEKGKKYDVSEQQEGIKKLFRSGNDYYLRNITRGEGLRINVQRVFDKVTAERINAFKEKMKKKKNDQEEFKEAA